jgi:hypothetical protein
MSAPLSARENSNLNHQNNQASNYNDLSREELIGLLLARDHDIKTMSSKFDEYVHNSNHQITEIMHRFGDLKKAYDEQSMSLLNTLWVHCAQNHPELTNIPNLEYDNGIVETETHIGNFIFGEFLGEGTFAVVKACRQYNYQLENDEEYVKSFDLAAKIIDKYKIKNFMTLKRLSDEIGVLKKLNSPSIIAFKDVIHTPKHLYIISDRGGQDMFEFLHQYSGAVDEDLAREITIGILQAVSYIHEQGICHRDLKPENILLSFPRGFVPSSSSSSALKPRSPLSVNANSMDFSSLNNPVNPNPSVIVKICDFGVCSKFRRKIMLQDFCGSPGKSTSLNHCHFSCMFVPVLLCLMPLMTVLHHTMGIGNVIAVENDMISLVRGAAFTYHCYMHQYSP